MSIFLKNLAAFLLGLVSVCVAIHACMPLPDVPQVKVKLQWLAAHPEEYDTIFIGSSRVRSGISPATYDAEMRSRGIPTRSYNFGIDAMTMPELSFVFDQVVTSNPRALRHVFIELNRVRWRLPELEGGTLREVYWHNPQYTALACEAALRDPRVPPSWHLTPPIISQHLSLMFANYGNLGRQSDLMKLGSQPITAPKPLGQDGTGFYPVAKCLTATDSVELTQKLKVLAPWEQRGFFDDPVLINEVARLAKIIRSLGCQAYFIVAPSLDNWRYNGPGSPLADDIVTFEFNDPSRFPALYLPEHRFDLQHLNTAGAEIFTKLLVTRMADYLATTSEVSRAE